MLPVAFEMTYSEVLTQSSSDWFDISQDVPWILGWSKPSYAATICSAYPRSVINAAKSFCTYGILACFGVARFYFLHALVNIGAVEGIVSLSDLGMDPPKRACMDKTMTDVPPPVENRTMVNAPSGIGTPNLPLLVRTNKSLARCCQSGYELGQIQLVWVPSVVYTTNNVVVDQDQESTLKKLLEIQTQPDSYDMVIITPIDDNPPVLTYCWYWDATNMHAGDIDNQAKSMLPLHCVSCFYLVV